MIMTKKGLVRVENLCPDDRVLTRDNGFQPVAWVGARRFNPEIERPISLPVIDGNGDFHERRLLLSPEHRVLRVESGRSVHQQAEETLVKAKDFAMSSTVGASSVFSNFYVHVLFEEHQIILAEGAWVESLRPTPEMIAGLSPSNHVSMTAQLPKVASLSGQDFEPARPLAA